MTPEERDLLQKTYVLSQENNGLLKKVRTSQKVSTATTIFYWTVVILLTFGSFWFLQPYLGIVQKALDVSNGHLDQISK